MAASRRCGDATPGSSSSGNISLRRYHVCCLIGALILALPAVSACQELVAVPVQATLDSLLANEDTDKDDRITIDDPHIQGTDRGNKAFWLVTTEGKRFEVAGTYFLSNLLQELSLARESGQTVVRLNSAHIFEPPADRISRTIRERLWDGLTRRLDEWGLPTIFADPKSKTYDGRHYVFVPPSDELAFSYYSDIAARHPDWRMEVVRLPDPVTPDYVRHLDGYHGILSLALEKEPSGRIRALPFVVPGGRFNEMYGWDSYFIVLGLLNDGKTDLAKSMVDNAMYEIMHYGAILNANRTYYLTRSQPPFFTSMALAVYKKLPKNKATRDWLRGVMRAAVLEYTNVWMGPDRLTSTGLSRYFDTGYGPPPEAGDFEVEIAAAAQRNGMQPADFLREYMAGRLKDPALDRYFKNDRAMRESGHDTSYRLVGVCADLVTVDLNSLLYKVERDIAATIRHELGDTLRVDENTVERSLAWEKRAEKRKELVDKYLWNAERGMYFDYDVVRGAQSRFVSATTLYPLWAGLASKEQAARLVQNAVPLLMAPGGVLASTEESRGPITPDRPQRQWDYPYGWPPHQMIVWQGLLNYGEQDLARRFVYRWLYTITINAVNYNGTVPEKFDVVQRSHLVFAEYGNVGTTFSYITREGFGWTNASYQIGLSLLPRRLRERLNLLTPPEWMGM